MIDGLLAAEDDVVPPLFGVVGDQRCRVQGILRQGVNANGIVRTNGQGLADHRVAIGFTHGHSGDRAAMLLLQFEGTHQRVPLIVRIHNELNAVGVKLCVAFREGNPACCVRSFADANEEFHGH